MNDIMILLAIVTISMTSSAVCTWLLRHYLVYMLDKFFKEGTPSRYFNDFDARIVHVEEKVDRFFGIMTKEYGSKIASNGEKVDHIFGDHSKRIKELEEISAAHELRLDYLQRHAGLYTTEQEMDDK